MDTRRQRACIWLIPIFLLFCTSSLIFSQTTPDLNDSLVQAPPDTIKTGMLIKLTQTLKNDHPEQAFEYGQHAIEMASELKEPLLLGKAYMAVAEIYILWSQYDKSLEYLLLSLDQFEQVNDKTEIALC